MSALGEGLGGSERASRVSRVDPGELPTRRRGGRHRHTRHTGTSQLICGAAQFSLWKLSAILQTRTPVASLSVMLQNKRREPEGREQSRRSTGPESGRCWRYALRIESTTCLCERSRHSHVHRTQTCFFCGEFASTVGSGEACSRPLRTPTLRHCRHNAQTRRHLLGANIVVYGSYSCPSTAMRS